MDDLNARQVPEVSWRGLNGNPYNARLHPQMLTSTYRDLRTIRLPPSRGTYSDPVDCYVLYDRSFVVEKLLKLVVEPLQLNSKDELQGLIDEAWELSCSCTN